ncbi:septal ring lytic transglycosylase RlpA family protein [Stakelama saccharophila]|uniref:Endolytic peptidoglycan transglycosylase RlpA n=1 Tax=Stakelama saccharophila TaxID=3075605 RepID=A0ABZ0BD56_9SPHN|nr:septal ring lytic transglycosylase RlpA family protein [Stakelama sp. W311]WNO54641.1 septal ring lytic transglycosylase RlpA family protein [Stakelama sp. W311]
MTGVGVLQRRKWRAFRRRTAAGAALLLVSACAGRDYKPVSDLPVKIGNAYTVRGKVYTPKIDPDYDVLGYASWYGGESGDMTANGEKFRPNWITAAHKTLPLPTYVEVTNLDTGKRIVVRINDRGPFARGRILDLSRGAAQELGMLRAGTAPVRVRRVEPPESDRERLREGDPAAERPRVPDPILRNLRTQLAAGVRAGLVEAP